MYVKVFSSITESSLWGESTQCRVLFVSMLAKADASGFVEASLPGLARVANLTMEETESALEVLKSPDEYSKNPENEGRRIEKTAGGWQILNYKFYRNIRDEDAKREYMREYMREYRKKQKRKTRKSSVGIGGQELAQEEAEAEEEAESKPKGFTLERAFVDFWNVVHTKTQKGNARKAFAKACDLVAQQRDWPIPAAAEHIIERMQAFAKTRAANPDDHTPIHPATWLNRECWDDDPSAWDRHGDRSLPPEGSEAAEARAKENEREARKKRVAAKAAANAQKARKHEEEQNRQYLRQLAEKEGAK